MASWWALGLHAFADAGDAWYHGADPHRPSQSYGGGRPHQFGHVAVAVRGGQVAGRRLGLRVHGQVQLLGCASTIVSGPVPATGPFMSALKQHSRDFRPPFCPNPNCPYHNGLSDTWRYKKTGFFWRQAKPHRIQRFTCLHCRRSFSSQTFSTTYWLRRPDIYPQLLTKTVGCMANRQVARDLGVAPATIDRQLGRLGRHCMVFHARLMAGARPLREIVIDGFVTFERSPVPAVSPSHRRRKGHRLLCLLHRQRGSAQRIDDNRPETAALRVRAVFRPS